MSGSERSSTLGGPGWVPRSSSHLDEVAAGRLWTRCGYRSETDPLLDVLLVEPPRRMGEVADRPGDYLMNKAVDVEKLRAEIHELADAFRRHGANVHIAAPGPDVPPNAIFARDLFMMTPGGAIVGRMASEQRAGEESFVTQVLAVGGYPIVRTVSGLATFEGADALWLDRETVVLGVGFRTNAAGARAVHDTLAEQGIEVVEVPLGPGVQHLLGSLVFLDEGLAAVYRHACSQELLDLLHERNISLLEFEPSEELLDRRGMNLVSTGPRSVIMPANCPSIRKTLEVAEVQIEEVDVSQAVRAAGAIGCLTGILRRGTHDTLSKSDSPQTRSR